MVAEMVTHKLIVNLVTHVVVGMVVVVSRVVAGMIGLIIVASKIGL